MFTFITFFITQPAGLYTARARLATHGWSIFQKNLTLQADEQPSKLLVGTVTWWLNHFQWTRNLLVCHPVVARGREYL